MKLVVILIYLCSITGAIKYEQDDNIRESTKQSGREKLADYQRHAQTSSCWYEAVIKLNSSCKAMNDKDQSRLALSLANCHLERSGRQTYACPTHKDIQYCTNRDIMDDLSFQVYTEFYTHAEHVCYFIQSQLWQANTEGTINRLSDVSTLAVAMLEESLTHHKELRNSQDMVLDGQAAILEGDKKIAESLKETEANIDHTFQEISRKTEQHKNLLYELLESLDRGMGGINWLLSSILGEIMSLETAIFFITTLLLITFLPQFGLSRVWLYSILTAYGLMEGVVRRCVLWAVAYTDSTNAIINIHFIQWYSRWSIITILGVVYLWRLVVYIHSQDKQFNLLKSLHQQLSDVHNLILTKKNNLQRSSFVVPSASGNDPLRLDHQYPPSTDGNNEVVELSQLYERENNKGHIVSGTQLIDFLSALYIHQKLHTVSDCYTDSSNDATYQPNVSPSLDPHTMNESLNDTHDSGYTISPPHYNLRPRSKISTPIKYTSDA
jgi:hypothetical protein